MRRVFSIVWLCAIWSVAALTTNAADFYPITSVEIELPQAGNLWPESNLIQGPGVGFDADEPHDKTLNGEAGNWVTDACGFPCDYIDTWGIPVIKLDMGTDRALNEVSVWGYAASNANGVSEFSLRFASDADGPDGFGTSIAFNPTYSDLDNDDLLRQSFDFGQDVTARYIEFTTEDNFFEPPGDGSAGETPGGDRVGLGEIAFEAPDGVIDPGEPLQFYEIQDIDVTTDFSDLWPVQNLIQGPGEGFLEEEPYTKILGGAEGNWVTDASCGFPCDFIEQVEQPVITIDLGQDVELNEVDIWGYASSNANGVSEFSLRFATDADGPEGYGSSIQYNPTFSDLPNDDTNRQAFPLDQTVNARYVEFTATDNFFIEPGDGSGGETPGGDRVGFGEIAFPILEGGGIRLQAGDADQNLEFNQLDLVQVQISAKYLTGQDATWGEGDWNAAPGGSPGNPPPGDNRFNQLDIIAALNANVYLTGPYAAVAQGGSKDDGQTSLVYEAATGELLVDAPAGKELTSINITSAASLFIGDKPAVLDGAFDNFAADNLFKATFGGSFGSTSFGTVLQPNLAEEQLLSDLSAVGSLAGGGDLGNVDLVYVPEPGSITLLFFSLTSLLCWNYRFRR